MWSGWFSDDARRIRRVGMIPQPVDAGERRVQRTERLRLAERSASAEALRGNINDVGPHAPDVFVVEAPLRDHAAAIVLDDDVGSGTQLQRQLASARGAQVEADALLPAALVVERPRAVGRVGLDGHRAQEVEIRARLDLDDLSAELRQHPAHLRPDRADAEVDHAQCRRASGAPSS